VSALVRLTTIAALLSLVLACATVTPEQAAREALASGYVVVETTANTARTLHEAGLITDERRAVVRESLTTALAGLDAAQRALALAQWATARTQALAAVGPVRRELEQLQEVTP
jgi:hypothetical protein